MQALAALFPDTALAVTLDVADPKQRIGVIQQSESCFGSHAARFNQIVSNSLLG
jgi:hypothetical protein